MGEITLGLKNTKIKKIGVLSDILQSQEKESVTILYLF